ncbi:putative ribonuclease H-like domain-containing protein [Tanacetum coccineum]
MDLREGSLKWKELQGNFYWFIIDEPELVKAPRAYSTFVKLRAEFKNREMNQFCEMKGILRQFSVARTLQQNGVVGRRNMTLIEAARTMLADSKLPTTFWAEAVNTACYVQNRVLVVKPHNKTIYELFHGRISTLSFMRLFGCHVTILNTLDHLGKFDGKADEGLFVGYSLNSKAFRVFNSRTRIVEENLHIKFSKSTPNAVGSKTFSDVEKKADEDPRKESEFNDQEKKDNVNSTNNVNAASTNKVNAVGGKTSIKLPFDPNMLTLEDVSIFDFSRDDDDVGAEADMNNLYTTIQVSPIPTTRIHKDHPLDQVIGDFQSATQTRQMSKNLKEHGAFLYGRIEEEVYVCQPLGFEDPDFPDRVYKVEKALYGYIKLLDLGVKTANTPMETQKRLLKDEDGEEVDVHMYRSMIGSLMYLTSSRPDIMYLKGQPKLGLWYPKDSPFDLVSIHCSDYAGASLDRKFTTGVAVDKVLWIQNKLIDYGPKTTAWNEFSSTMAYAIICLATNQKFNFSKFIFEGMIRNLDNVSGKFLMYLRFVQVFLNQQLDELPTHKRIYNASSHTKKIFRNMRRVGKGFSGRVTPLFPTMAVQHQSQMDEDEAVYKKLGDSLVRAATTASSLEAKQVSETMGDTIAQTRFENVSKLSNDSLLARGNTLQSDSDRLKLNELMELYTTLQKKVLDLEKTKTTQANEIASLKRRVTKLEKKRSSRTHKLKRLYKVGLSARVESSGDEESFGEDTSKQGRRINAIDADEDITLVNVQDDADNEMFDVNVLNGEEVFIAGQNENFVEEVVDAAQVSTAAKTVTITTEEITLAQALKALKTSKPMMKGIVFQEPGESTTTKSTPTISSQQSQDKGKGIMIEEPVKPTKKKVQIMLDEEVALKLQAKFDEEERLAREKAKKEKEVNIALTEEWDDIQAKIKVDHELAQRLQGEEQEELSVEEKAKLFQQFLEQRRKHFAVKSAEEKRNKPPTQAQQRKVMRTYLKNMEGKKLKDLKNKYFDSIKKMFDRAFKMVNTFVDFRTDLVEELMEVQRYLVFSQLLKSVDREDLVELYKLVNAKYGSTRPVEDMDLLLWRDLKTMFEPHVEDEIWKLQQSLRINEVFRSILLVIMEFLMEKLDDFGDKYQVYGRIVRIKTLLNAASITAAHIRVNAAQLC